MPACLKVEDDNERVEDFFMTNGCRDMLSKNLVAKIFTDGKTHTQVHTLGRRDGVANTTIYSFGNMPRI